MTDNIKLAQTLAGKKILVTGGTGTIGKVLVRRLLSGEMGKPAKVIVFSRDEAKQHFMRLEYRRNMAATEEVIYRNFQRKLEFRIGDIRDFHSVANALRDADVVINAAALKQVPTSTPESDAMSKDLKQRGFKFVGSTICYAHMQACGMVNDHTVDCFRHRELA